MIRGQGRPDDGLVERGKEDPDHHGAEDAHADGVGELDRWTIHRSDPCLHRLGHLGLLSTADDPILPTD